jgi:lipopolysaccharide biosynthesis glycosyltransferase
MNLSRIRAKYNLPAEGNEWVKKWAYLSSMLDQDFINARFRGDILFIDGKFNRGLYCSDITDTIIHASGSPKPWDSPEGTAAESLYWKSYLKTAWALREGREKTVDLIMEAVRNSTWTHRHTANCCRNILSRLKKEVLTNNYAVRILTLPAKYLYCRVGNRTAGIEK